MNQSKLPADGTGIIDLDPWLEPHRQAQRDRYQHYLWLRQELDKHGGLSGQISQGHRYFGFNRGQQDGQDGVWYREWAPNANYLSLIGDFNGWDRGANPMQRDDYGIWHLFLPDALYADRLTHESLVKVHVAAEGYAMDRIPAYITRVLQEEGTPNFNGQYWCPDTPYQWQHDQPGAMQRGLRIYEAHVGMAVEELREGTYEEFTRDVLQRVKDLGYNTIQLMAIMEHPYYGSFGYHVSNFYAVSSRFGTPDDLKRLVDTAHGMGIRVIMDLIHSHCVKNTSEGLSFFDGTEYQYFHGGAKGQHTAWDSLCFDYSKYEVQRFLLSNVRYWLEEYRFDGFRFDGVTSMLYLDHGLGKAFSSYDDYYDGNVDRSALAYLMLANDVAHATNPHAICIAEDMSGMPGLARGTEEGGLGFDYRLAMGIPDFWIKTLKEQSDDQWNLNNIYHTLLNRRHNEKHIGYAESHDQALVGDKTLAFWLMDADMYWHMSVFTPDMVIDRGIALHKMIRLITFALGGEGYLNFMGNEFGHPEWIDFPREGNGWSFQHARRQWSLVDAEHLRYRGLNNFDRAMMGIDQRFNILADKFIEQLAVHEDSKQLVCRRGPLVFAFNFHPTESYTDLRIPVADATDYQVVLNSDDKAFEGHGLVEEGVVYPWQDVEMYGRKSTQIYLPSRSAQVLAPRHLVQD